MYKSVLSQMKPGVILAVTACVVWWILIASSELDFYYKLITGLFVCLPIISLIIVLWCNFSKRLNATPNKARLTTLYVINLYIFRHITQKFLDIRQYAFEISMQSDEKSDCVSAAQSLCGVA